MIRLLIISICLGMFITSCAEKGPFEKAGSRADEIADNVKDGDPILHKKGTMEKAGEALDDAVKGKD